MSILDNNFFPKMEVVSLSNTPHYRKIILQHGKGMDKEGYYIYDQNGEGVGAIFSSVLRGALPILAPIAARGVKKLAKKLAKKGIKGVKLSVGNNLSTKKARRRSNRIKKISAPYPVKARI